MTNHDLALRRAKRNGAELRSDLRCLAVSLATSPDLDDLTVQRLEGMAKRIARHVLTMQVLEDCTPEPEPPVEPEPVAPEAKGPRYAVEVSATPGLDVDEWRAGMVDYALHKCRPDSASTQAYREGRREAQRIAEMLIGPNRAHCLEGAAAYAAGWAMDPETEHAFHVHGYRSAHAALQRRLGGES